MEIKGDALRGLKRTKIGRRRKSIFLRNFFSRAMRSSGDQAATMAAKSTVAASVPAGWFLAIAIDDV